MEVINFKNLSKLVLIDFISIALIYLLTRFLLDKIRTYYQLIQNLTPNIDILSFNLQKNTSLLDINQLANKLDLISNLSNKILLLLFVLALISFLIYILSQSINWNLTLNDFKLKNYKSYLKRFTLINIPIFLVLIYLIFKIILRARVFILDYWFEAFFNQKEFFIILLFVLLLFLIIYLAFYLYVLINKNSLQNSLLILYKNFYKKPGVFFVFLITIFLAFLIFIFFLRINPNSIILTIISTLIFLIIFNIFRIYLSNRL